VEIVRANLHRLPGRFERLVAVAALQNAETRGQFSDVLPAGYDREAIDLALGREHRAIFEQWLALPLEEKLDDLELYTSPRGETAANVAAQWLCPGQRSPLVPVGALPPERHLFESDMRLLLLLWPAKETMRRASPACM
jgi:hypothetical protein